MSHLFEPLTIRGVTFRNRIAVSPMCEYSSIDGLANEWHLVHLGSRAVGGAGLVITEAAAVQTIGRISPNDLGIYSDSHIEPLANCTRFIIEHGAVPGIQLAHAGRKASTARPWDGGKPVGESEGGWSPIVAPSAIPFAEGYQTPAELTKTQLREIVRDFARAAERSLSAGFQLVEIHAAHGYLLHEFLSPLSNHRTDSYGGSFENRTRIVIEVAQAIRQVWPSNLPVFVRISSTDWTPGGWDITESVELSKLLLTAGVDLIDCSSGGNVAAAAIPIGPGYQTAFADQIKRDVGILTGAVGMVTSPQQADHILRTGQADIVLLARELLRDPYWPLRAAHELRQQVPSPKQYGRAWS